MKNRKMLVLIAVMGLLAAGPLVGVSFAYNVYIDSTTPATFTTYTASESGPLYFDNTSNDGTNMNAGFQMQNLLGATAETASGATATSNIWFSNGLSDAFKLFNIAGYKGVTSFGYYEVNSDGSITGSPVLHEVFAAGTLAPATASNINLPSYFGLYIDVNGTTYYSDQMGMTTNPDNGNNHFAVFTNNGDTTTLYICMEDLPLAAGDKDYNDMGVAIAPVPLPGALLLLGAGLVRLAGYARRKRSRA